MPRRLEEEGPEPEGGGAAERLRQHLESRFEPDDWPEDVPIEDVRDEPREGTEAVASGEALEPALAAEPEDESDESEDEADEPAEMPLPFPDLEEREEPPESNAYELNEDEGEDLTE